MLPVNTSNVEKSLVLIDYANLLSAVKYLNKKLDLKALYEYLTSLGYIKKVSFYYGTDPRNPKSINFINWLRKTGYEVITKDVKYIKINLAELMHSKKNELLLSKLDKVLIQQLDKGIKELEAKGLVLEQAKCNLDIEIALDIYNSFNVYDSYILFSGDSDFENILKIARAKGKHITVISLRKFTAGELIKVCDKYINLTSLQNIPNFLYDDVEKEPKLL